MSDPHRLSDDLFDTLLALVGLDVPEKEKKPLRTLYGQFEEGLAEMHDLDLGEEDPAVRYPAAETFP
jgi:hypothetical protein